MRLPDIDPSAWVWRVQSHSEVWAKLHNHRAADDRPLIIGVDGHGGAGKSTLAAELAASDPTVAVVHTDDVAWHHSFFGWDDILIRNLLMPLRSRRTPLSYRPPTWDDRGRPGTITIEATATVVLVEGTGVARRNIVPFLDAVVWVYVDHHVARRRLIARGDSEQFIDEWLAEENAVMALHRPWELADLIVAHEDRQSGRAESHRQVKVAVAPRAFRV